MSKSITVADLPVWESTKEFTRKDGSRYAVEPRHPMLYCEDCGQTSSANPGDYWDLPKSHVFMCCEQPMRLVNRLTVYQDVSPEVCPSCGSDEGQYVPPGSGDAACLHCGAGWPVME